jgi:integrase
VPAPSTPALAAVAEYLATLDGASRSLRRQRSWALHEAIRFAAARRLVDVTAGIPLDDEGRDAVAAACGRVRLADLLTDDFAEHWAAHADAVLRGAPDPVGATRRARLASLRALAAFADAEIPAHRDGRPVLRPTLARPQLDVALRVLTQRLPGRGPDDHVRLAALLSVVSVWPARSQELSALRLDQLSDDGTALTLAVEPEPVVLRGVAAERLRQWLAVRAELIAALSGGPVRALWVSIKSNSRPGGPSGSLPLPPGMPLRPRGVQRAYARSVEAANALHSGVPGFPLPRSLDLLRRSLQSLEDG